MSFSQIVDQSIIEPDLLNCDDDLWVLISITLYQQTDNRHFEHIIVNDMNEYHFIRSIDFRPEARIKGHLVQSTIELSLLDKMIVDDAVEVFLQNKIGE